MTDTLFVALDDWHSTCSDLAELTDTLADLSSRPYTAYTLLEVLKQVAQQEVADWDKVRQFGFTNRDEALVAYAAECVRRNIKH